MDSSFVMYSNPSPMSYSTINLCQVLGKRVKKLKEAGSEPRGTAEPLSTFGTYILPDPGSGFFRCISASMSEGVTDAMADCSLFFQPVTTSPSPRIMASKPV